MPGEDELKQEVARELRAIDEQALFWLDVAVATADGASAADVDWTAMDWPMIRQELETWLHTLDPETLDPSTPETTRAFRVPGRDDVLFAVRARPRSPRNRGVLREPSLVFLEPDTIPDLQFEDGSSGSLYALPIDMVRDLAIGHKRLAIELASHRETWDLLLETMEAMGYKNTSEMNPRMLEPTASALGFIEAPPELGDFDETWSALHGLDNPMLDDPRTE